MNGIRTKYFMYFVIYKTTNLINNKIYVGCHITSDINDGYLGSGKILNQAIKKYGINSFSKEILHIFDNPEEMFNKEKEIVNEEFVSRKDTYNLTLGGGGGWYYVNINGLNWSYEKNRRISGFKNVPSHIKEQWLQKAQAALKIQRIKIRNGEIPDPRLNRATFKGKAHSEHTKIKMSAAHKKNGDQIGTKNSQYGTMWVTNDTLNLKIKKNELDKYLKEGYRKGRVNVHRKEGGQDGNAADC